MPEMKEVVLTVRVKVPQDMSPATVARLVQRLIESGESDAENVPPGWHDDDVPLIARMEPIYVDQPATP